jgi:hypothetical protein
VLALIIMGSVPLALIGSVVALWIAGLPLSVASLVGFVTLTGIATRNGILKTSHYINLALHEGVPFGPDLVIRGTLERLTPVLMTALSACVALFPVRWSVGNARPRHFLPDEEGHSSMAIRKGLNRDIESTNHTALNLSRRNFCVTAFASAIGDFTLAQGPARAAIVRTDDSSLPPYGNSTLPPGIRSRIVNNINGLAMHVLEAGFEPKGRPCVLLLHGFPELAYSPSRLVLTNAIWDSVPTMAPCTSSRRLGRRTRSPVWNTLAGSRPSLLAMIAGMWRPLAAILALTTSTRTRAIQCASGSCSPPT